MTHAVAALVPVKDFAVAKGRLEPALSPSERSLLARELATAVVQALRPMPTFIACEDPDVSAWAASLDTPTIRTNVSGLNRVVRRGVKELRALGYRRALITHADLADPAGLSDLASNEGVVLVPDRHLAGTNVMVIPTDAGFRFSYGEGSFARHLSEAERLGRPITIVRDPGLALDLDDPDDLAEYASRVAAVDRDSPEGARR